MWLAGPRRAALAVHAAAALAALTLSACGGEQTASRTPELGAHEAGKSATGSASRGGASSLGTSSSTSAPSGAIARGASTVSSPGASPTTGGSVASSPRAAFPPPDVTPPFERSAAEGDGHWTALGTSTARDRAAEGTLALYRTLLHPHETSRFITLTLVAIDLTAVAVRWLPGTEDVGKSQVPFVPGLVPPDQRERLLAIFNGGFQPRHGRWGMKLGDTTVMPPREPGCTIGIHRDGSLSLGPWSTLAAKASELVAIRQTPQCLLEQGELHPDLVAGRDKAWAGHTPGLVTRRRSALGIDRGGKVLFYAIGVEATPKLLADGLRVAGAVTAAELDINWNWTRFLLFGKSSDGELRATTSLVEGEYAKTGYVALPSERDFFYVLAK